MTRRWLKRGLVVFGVILAVWLAVAVLLGVIAYGQGRTDHAEPSDVIVVLGSGLRRDNTAGPALYRRAAKAADLYAQGIAPAIICTGGIAENRTRSEADACAEILTDRGVPASAIVLEERSRSTIENAQYTRDIMDGQGWDTAVVVSDGYHLLRASWIFRDLGLEVVTSPAETDPPPYTLFVSLAREVAALHLQALISLFNLPITHVPVM